MPTLYWRQKARDSCDEFEVRFEPPVTGVSSGRATVGAHIIINTEDDDSFRKYRVSENAISGEMDLKLNSSIIILDFHFAVLPIDAKRLSLELMQRIRHPDSFLMVSSFPEGSLTTGGGYETSKEMLRRLRDEYEAQLRADEDR
jgi:hypothetical protein